VAEHASSFGPFLSSSLLGSLSEPDRNALLGLGRLVQYSTEKHVLITESERSTFVLVLLDGIVKVTRLTENGQQAFLAVRISGDVVGEFASLDGGVRSATVTTGGPVTARHIPGPDFTNLLQQRPSLAAAVARTVVSKARTATDARVDFLSYDGIDRMARVLHDLVMRHGRPAAGGVEVGFSVTQAELAGLASLSEPQAQRVLRDLRKLGIIGSGRLHVLDVEQLSARAGRPPPGRVS
jgi:CRP-like cAMP-binding protein